MEWLTLIVKIITLVLIIAAGSSPAVAAFLVKARKKHKKIATTIEELTQAKDAAETAAAEEKAHADLMEKAKSFIACEEDTLFGFDKIMKAQGTSGGPMKKDLVFIKLQAYALQCNYKFDVDYWSEIIDDLVEFTKNVNVNKK